MSRLTTMVCWFACLHAAVTAQEPVRVAWTAEPAAPLLGQPVVLTLRVDFDAAFFAAQGLPLLQRAMDVPFCLELAGGAADDWRWQDAADGPRVVVDGREVRARRVPATGEGAFVGLELTASRACNEVGDFSLGRPIVRYAFTSGFETSLLGGRQPLDRTEAAVEGPALTLRVRELPTAGRPASFSGAIGRFTVAAEAPAQVEVGDSFELTLIVRGEGNLQAAAAPPWPELDAFAVQGMAESATDGERRFGFDVLALRQGTQRAALPFSFFDPQAGEYRTVTAAVTVEVVARSPGRALSPRVRRLVDEANAGGGAVSFWWWGLAIAGLAIVLVGVRRRGGRGAG